MSAGLDQAGLAATLGGVEIALPILAWPLLTQRS